MTWREQKTKEWTNSLKEAESFRLANRKPEDEEIREEREDTYWMATVKTFTKNKFAMFLLSVLLLLILFTVVQPYLPGQKDPNLIYNSRKTGQQIRNQSPNRDFWFGTNSIGQDLWSRTWAGARTSLFLGFTVALIEAAIGTVVGLLWGYVRKLDGVFTEIYNLLDNIPSTIVLILISYILRPGISTLILALCATGWIEMARFIRNQMLLIRDKEFNIASRMLGTSTFRILRKNCMPYLVSIILMRISLSIPSVIGSEVFVTYLGLGLPLNIPSLGNLIQSGRAKLMMPGLRYQLLFPTLIVSIITISFYLIGNAFADAADPKNHR